MKGLFSSLFYCESGIDQHTGQKTLTDVFGSSLLLLDLSTLYFHNIHNIHASCFYERSEIMYSEMIYLVFCSVQLKSTFLTLSDTEGIYTFWPNLDNFFAEGQEIRPFCGREE